MSQRASQTQATARRLHSDRKRGSTRIAPSGRSHVRTSSTSSTGSSRSAKSGSHVVAGAMAAGAAVGRGGIRGRRTGLGSVAKKSDPTALSSSTKTVQRRTTPAAAVQHVKKPADRAAKEKPPTFVPARRRMSSEDSELSATHEIPTNDGPPVLSVALSPTPQNQNSSDVGFKVMPKSPSGSGRYAHTASVLMHSSPTSPGSSAGKPPPSPVFEHHAHTSESITVDRKQLQELRDSIASAKARQSETDADLKASKAVEVKLKSILSGVEASLKKVTAQRDKLWSGLSQAVEQRDSLREKETKLAEELKRLKEISVSKSKKSDSDALHAIESRHERELEDLHTKEALLISSHRREVAELQQKIDSEAAVVADRSKQLSLVLREREALKRDSEALKQALRQKMNECKKEKEKMESLCAQREKDMKRVMDVSAVTEGDLRAEIDRLNAVIELKSSMEKDKQMESENDRDDDEHSEAMAMKNAISNLGGMISDLGGTPPSTSTSSSTPASIIVELIAVLKDSLKKDDKDKGKSMNSEDVNVNVDKDMLIHRKALELRVNQLTQVLEQSLERASYEYQVLLKEKAGLNRTVSSLRNDVSKLRAENVKVETRWKEKMLTIQAAHDASEEDLRIEVGRLQAHQDQTQAFIAESVAWMGRMSSELAVFVAQASIEKEHSAELERLLEIEKELRERTTTTL